MWELGKDVLSKVAKGHARFIEGIFLGIRSRMGEHIGKGHKIIRPIRRRPDLEK